MDNRTIGALAGLVSILGVVVAIVPGYLISRWADYGFERVLPMFDTVGTTITAYSYIIAIVEPLVLLALGVGLGYYVAQRVTVATEYRRFTGSIAAGSTIGVVLGLLLLLLIMSRGGNGQLPDDALGWFFYIAVFVRAIANVALPITVGAVAGAAITYFRSEGPPPAEPSGTTTDPTNDAASIAPSTDETSDSRPVTRH